MTTFEKIVKYAATGFAALLAVGIVIGVLKIGYVGITAIAGGNADLQDTTATFDKDEVDSIYISNNVADVEIYTTNSSKITIEATDVFESFSCTVSRKGTLNIDNSKKNVFSALFNKSPKIIIYLPEDLSVNTLELNGGVGDIEAENLNINQLIIDGGVGDIEMDNCNIKDGDFDTGIGDFNIKDSTLLNASIDNGIGDITLELNGNIDDYSFEMDNGIGEIRINDKKASYYPEEDGKYEIECDNGIGDIKITIK